MAKSKGDFCPLIRKSCIEDKCKFWTHIRGKDPQGQKEIDYPDCSIKWLPVLLIENAQVSREVGAAVESARNEQAQNVATIAGAVLSIHTSALQHRGPDGPTLLTKRCG